MSNFYPIIKTECRIDCVAYTPSEIAIKMSPKMGELVKVDYVRPAYCTYMRINIGDTDDNTTST